MTTTVTGAGRQSSRTGTRTKAAARSALVDRYIELQALMQRHLKLSLHRELRDELQSVTIHQLGVLFQLRGGSLAMRELARELGVGESATTAVVDRLVRQGLVTRHDDPSDRRVVRLALSSPGESFVTKLHDAMCRSTSSMLAVLSDDQLSQLVVLMEALEPADVTSSATCSPSGKVQGR